MKLHRCAVILALVIGPIALFAVDIGESGEMLSSRPRVEAQELEASRTAPWKMALAGDDRDQADLGLYEWRLGTWESATLLGELEERHRVRIVYQWDLNESVLVGTSKKLFEDGREDRYLEAIFLPHGTRRQMVTFLFFDDGLFADAVWTDDGGGVQRLDCDLVWPDGRTARVRDVFTRQGEDAFSWVMYWVRDGAVDDNPSFQTVMQRVK